ncbi:unnamed protein product [Mytilus edulis]|uniref:Uncharacterized protein n=1 Tax=Mytilus edulis TaxID=6550 RepID=A0A8S3VIG7_MYTED|nr:unnamed protein product [Mytilus edulis]
MTSTIEKSQRKMKTNELDSSYTHIAVIISGMAASITFIAAFIALRKFIDTWSRVKNSELTDNEQNNTINDVIDLIETPDGNGQMDKKYNNVPPNSHMDTINGGINVTKTLKWNGRINKEYNNIPPESNMHTLNGGCDFIKTLKCNVQIKGIHKHST